MKVVVDSSVLIAAHVARAGVCAEVYEELLQHHEIFLSRYILDEVERNLRRKFLLPDELVERAVTGMTRAAPLVDPVALPDDDCRDSDDLPVLGTAVAAEAELLVTVDKDLLDLRSYRGVDVVRPGEFFRRAGNRGHSPISTK